MKIIEVPIEKLKFNENHLRINITKKDKMFGYLLSSITNFGLQYPLLINKDYEVISGNQILRVLKFLNWDKVSCVISDIAKDKEMDLSVALDKINNTWHIAKLVDYFTKHNYFKKQLKAMGWENIEIDSLLAMNELPDLKKVDFLNNRQNSLFD